MPLFRLSHDIAFPPPHLSTPEGLIAVGGDLSPRRLLEAYRCGIFPWFSEGDPILWWSPDPRMVLYPEEIKISRSLQKTLRQGQFTITMDTCFNRVIEACAKPRNETDGTWILPTMIQAYGRLHELGYAHSIEAWVNKRLAGGLYGVSLGGCFFGESMFSDVDNASKAALVHLARFLQERDGDLIDCQIASAHLVSLGARSITRKLFLEQLGRSLRKSTLVGVWTDGSNLRERGENG
jgi:leucyl/phenylalanyl-tRNA--protein transferase